jgi:hypothetical protein
LDHALTTTQGAQEHTELDRLERDVFALIARGSSDPEIAARLGLELVEVQRLHRSLTHKIWRRAQRLSDER